MIAIMIATRKHHKLEISAILLLESAPGDWATAIPAGSKTRRPSLMPACVRAPPIFERPVRRPVLAKVS